MRVQLTKLDLMPNALSSKLQRTEIENTSQLLDKGAWPWDRRKWLEEVDLTEGEIRPWLIVADLCRIREMPVDLAQRLALNGKVDSVQALGRMTTSNLEAAVEDSSVENQLADEGLKQQKLARLITVARKTVSRLVWDLSSGDLRHFEDIEQAHFTRNQENLQDIVFAIGCLIVFTAAVLTGAGILFAELGFRLDRASLALKDLEPSAAALMVNTIRETERSNEASYIVAFMLAMVACILLIAVVLLAHWASDKVIFQKLTRNQLVRGLILRLHLRWSWSWLPHGLGLVLILPLLLFVGILESIVPRLFTVGTVSAFSMLFGILFILISLGEVTKARKSVGLTRRTGRPCELALQRYLFCRLIAALTIPIELYVASTILFVFPRVHQAALERILSPGYIQYAYKTMLFVWINDLSVFEHLLGEPSNELMFFQKGHMLDVSRMFLNSIAAWTVLASILVYFVFPFFLLRRFKEASLFTIIPILALVISLALGFSISPEILLAGALMVLVVIYYASILVIRNLGAGDEARDTEFELVAFSKLEGVTGISCSISRLDMMPEAIRASLKEHNVNSISDILTVASWPFDRRTWLQGINLTEEEMRPWIIVADLCRIREMPVDLAQRLALSGKVDSVQALGRTTAADLLVALQSCTTSFTRFQDTLQTDELRLLIEMARETGPRLIWDANDVNHFMDIHRVKSRRDFILSLVQSARWWWLFLKLTIVALFITILALRLQEVIGIFHHVPPDETFLRMKEISVGLMLGLLLITWTSILVVLDAISWIMNMLVKPLFARTRSMQRIFLLEEQRNEIYDVAVLFYSVPIALGFVLVGISALILGVNWLTGSRPVLVFLLVSGLMGVLHLTGDIVTLRRDIFSRMSVYTATLNRYLFFRLISVVAIWLRIIIGLWLLYFTIKVHERLVEHLLLPSTEELSALTMLSDDAWLSHILPALKAGIFWLLLMLAISYFLLPFLLMRRFKALATFIIVALVSSSLEAKLLDLMKSVVVLPPGSLRWAISAAVLILLNQAAFESAESIGEEPDQFVELVPQCSQCKQPVPSGAEFCSACETRQDQTVTSDEGEEEEASYEQEEVSSSDKDLSHLLSLNVTRVTPRLAEAILLEFGSFDALLDLSASDLQRVRGVGKRTADALFDALRCNAELERAENAISAPGPAMGDTIHPT